VGLGAKDGLIFENTFISVEGDAHCLIFEEQLDREALKMWCYTNAQERREKRCKRPKQREIKVKTCCNCKR
jgi:hypothetical protein